MLLWEGRSLTYVAEHSAATLAKRYAGVLESMEDEQRVSADPRFTQLEGMQTNTGWRDEMTGLPTSTLSRARLLLSMPLYWVLEASSCRAAAERDALRAYHILPSRREVIVDVSTPSDRRWVLLDSLSLPQVRTVLYHRLAHGTPAERIASKLLSRLWPALGHVELRCHDIGAGFVIQHGYGSVIWAGRIGQDCTIFQGVTLGLDDGNNERPPTLGDRVWVWPGATLIGVSLGDDSTVGANAVVIKDVPAGATVAGVPARTIRTSTDQAAG